MLLAALIAAIAWGVVHAFNGRRLLAAVSGGLGLGMLGFCVTALVVPRLTHQGQFHSFPFGGIACSESDIGLSLLVWILAAGALFASMARRAPAAPPATE